MEVRWIDHERLVRSLTTKVFVYGTVSRFGTYSVDHAINAGLDLEMPGLNKWRTLEQVERCIVAKKFGVSTIKERAKKVLELVQKSAKAAPEVRARDPLRLPVAWRQFHHSRYSTVTAKSAHQTQRRIKP